MVVLMEGAQADIVRTGTLQRHELADDLLYAGGIHYPLFCDVVYHLLLAQNLKFFFRIKQMVQQIAHPG